MTEKKEYIPTFLVKEEEELKAARDVLEKTGILERLVMYDKIYFEECREIRVEVSVPFWKDGNPAYNITIRPSNPNQIIKGVQLDSRNRLETEMSIENNSDCEIPVEINLKYENLNCSATDELGEKSVGIRIQLSR